MFDAKYGDIDKLFLYLYLHTGYDMFMEAGTPNARIYGHVIPHVQAALPGMHNENEQTAITNKAIFLHSFHATMTIFQKVYGWSVHTVFENTLALMTGQSMEKTQSMQSFFGVFLSATINMPATQVYKGDFWSVKNMMDREGPWVSIPGEDWGAANSSRYFTSDIF